VGLGAGSWASTDPASGRPIATRSVANAKPAVAWSLSDGRGFMRGVGPES
jgi:hypothetical protein